MDAQRKITIIALALFVVVVGGLFIAFRIVTKDATVTPNNNLDAHLNGGVPILFGGGATDPLNGADLGTTTPEGVEIIPRLRRISVNPIAGATIFDTKTDTVVRYAERATGHLFETSTTTLAQQRVGNTTIPRIQHALFVDGGDGVILQYLTNEEIIKSFYEPVATAGEGEGGVFLRNNLAQIVANADGSQVFSLTTNGNGYVSRPDGSNEKAIFSSSLTDWLGEWTGSSIFLTTKPSHGIEGFLFQLNITTGGLSKKISAEGMVAKQSADGSKILFSESTKGNTTLYIYTPSDQVLLELPFTTLADKCVWAGMKVYCGSPYETPGAHYPDDWYQGVASFSDDLWEFDLETEMARIVYDMEVEERHFDMTDLMVNDARNTLIFTDKKSLLLWSIAL